MTHAERLSDGRFNIVLQGLEKFRVLDEDDSRTYRLARVESMAEQADHGGEKDEMRLARRRLESLLVPPPHGRGGEPKVPPSMADEDLVNALAQYLELEPVEKQALLERDTPARPLSIAHRAAGDEGHGRPAQVGRGALNRQFG